MKIGSAALGLTLLLAAGVHARAATILSANLTGSQEVPPNASTATGRAVVMLDGNTLTVNLNFSGLIGGGVTGAHIHCCAAPGTNAPVRINFDDPFPYGATSGTYNDVFNLATALTGLTVPQFTAGFESGLAYVNLHNQTFPGGEIRGQLTPEPGTWAMLGGGMLVLFAGRRLRKH